MIQFIEKYNIKPVGVIHVGAHFGGEIENYSNKGIKNIIFVEPLSNTFDKLRETVLQEKYTTKCNIRLINKSLGNSSGTVEMYVETANQGQSSSILKPSHHLVQYPFIQFPYREIVELSTLNIELKDNNLDYNVLNIDVQGYELEVLKGATDILENIEIINIEVNKVEMYEGCALFEDIDNFLKNFDFVKVYEDWSNINWGDSIYVKKYLNK